jgi:hypothetical protein
VLYAEVEVVCSCDFRDIWREMVLCPARVRSFDVEAVDYLRSEEIEISEKRGGWREREVVAHKQQRRISCVEEAEGA